MKILLFISLVFLSNCAIRIPDGKSINDNSAILSFIEENEGNRVGKGVCFDLVRKAVEQKNKNWYKKVWCNNKGLKNCIVKIPKNGDIINFSGVVMKNGDRYSSHVGIIDEVLNDSLLIIAHQNICDSKDKKEIKYYGSKKMVCKESAVQLEVININQKIKGKILFYHF